jgi:Bacterial Ig-like domain (group 2)
MQRTLLLLAGFLVAITSACDDGVTTPTQKKLDDGQDPGGPAGVYVLRTVGADPLPTVVFANEGVTASMIADTIFLHADGTGAIATVEHVKESRPTSEYSFRGESPLVYEIAGGRLTAEIPCRDVITFAACVRPPHYTGVLSAAALDLDYALEFRVPMHYVRVAGPTLIKTVELSPSGSLPMRVGGSLQLTARLTDAQGRTIGGKPISWSSLIPTAATVSPTGLVRAVAEGNTLVTAFVEGRADTVTVKISR